MALSRYNTLALPSGTSSPQAIATAPSDRPSRVAVKNVSGATAIIGYPATALQSAAGAGGTQVFVLLPGDNEVVVLPVGVGLFGLSMTAGAVVSMAQSDALPVSQSDEQPFQG